MLDDDDDDGDDSGRGAGLPVELLFSRRYIAPVNWITRHLGLVFPQWPTF